LFHQLFRQSTQKISSTQKQIVSLIQSIFFAEDKAPGHNPYRETVHWRFGQGFGEHAIRWRSEIIRDLVQRKRQALMGATRSTPRVE
jgi:hypothetical protein